MDKEWQQKEMGAPYAHPHVQCVLLCTGDLSASSLLISLFAQTWSKGKCRLLLSPVPLLPCVFLPWRVRPPTVLIMGNSGRQTAEAASIEW